MYDLQDWGTGIYCSRAPHDEENLRYARVVTKNSFMLGLGAALKTVAFDLLDEYSHITFFSLISAADRREDDNDNKHSWFLVMFLVGDLIQLLLAMDRSRQAWKQDVLAAEYGSGGRGYGHKDDTLISNKADLILSSRDHKPQLAGPDLSYNLCPRCCFGSVIPFIRCLWRSLSFCLQRKVRGREEKDGYKRLSWYNEWRLYFYLVFFEYFGVRRSLVDASVQLHPFHKKQQWCSLRKDEARISVLGYSNKEMFRYEDSAGLEFAIPTQLIVKIVLLMFKVKGSIHNDLASLWILITVLPTVLGIYFKSVKLMVLRHDRRAFKAYLKDALGKDPSDQTLRGLYWRYFGDDRLTVKIKYLWRWLRCAPLTSDDRSYLRL